MSRASTYPARLRKCRVFTSNLFRADGAWGHRRLSRPAWLLAAVLIAWGVGSLGPALALAENLKSAGAGFAHNPRGDELWYGYSLLALHEGKDAGVMVVHYERSKDGIAELRADFDDDVAIVEEGEAAVCAFGKGDLTFGDGRAKVADCGVLFAGSLRTLAGANTDYNNNSRPPND